MTPINYFTSSLQEILDFMPAGATHKGRDYFLFIHKGAGGYSVQYSCREEAMHVDADGVHYVKTRYLFDTFRTGHTLRDALTSMLTLLHTYREQVLFIPRIHPFNQELPDILLAERIEGGILVSKADPYPTEADKVGYPDTSKAIDWDREKTGLSDLDQMVQHFQNPSIDPNSIGTL